MIRQDHSIRFGRFFILVGYIRNHAFIISILSKQFKRLPAYHHITAYTFIILHPRIVSAKERNDIITVVLQSSCRLCTVNLITGYDDTFTDQVIDSVQSLRLIQSQFSYRIQFVYGSCFSRIRSGLCILSLLKLMEPFLLFFRGFCKYDICFSIIQSIDNIQNTAHIVLKIFFTLEPLRLTVMIPVADRLAVIDYIQVKSRRVIQLIWLKHSSRINLLPHTSP